MIGAKFLFRTELEVFSYPLCRNLLHGSYHPPKEKKPSSLPSPAGDLCAGWPGSEARSMARVRGRRVGRGTGTSTRAACSCWRAARPGAPPGPSSLGRPARRARAPAPRRTGCTGSTCCGSSAGSTPAAPSAPDPPSPRRRPAWERMSRGELMDAWRRRLAQGGEEGSARRRP